MTTWPRAAAQTKLQLLVVLVLGVVLMKRLTPEASSAPLARLFAVDSSSAPPSAKTLYFVRHAQGTHNLYEGADHLRSERNLDAKLTKLGMEQCEALAEQTKHLCVELVVASPLTRTLQTAQLSFPCALEKGTPLLADENLRETVNYLADCRRPLSVLRDEFPTIDFTRIESEEDPVWKKYEIKFGDQSAYKEYRESNDRASLATRARAAFKFLGSRPENNIAIVSHKAFMSHLFYSTLGGTIEYGDEASNEQLCKPWENCDMRAVAVEFFVKDN